MEKRRRLALFVMIGCFTLLLRCAMATPQAGKQEDRSKDQGAIQRALDRFLSAWNTHDARAFSMTFAEDADFTNVRGTHERGRAKVEAFHAPMFAGIFKESHQTAKIRSIRFLTPKLAEVDVDWEMTGAKALDGSARVYRRGLLAWVMARQGDGAWLIEVMHNTDLTDYPAQKK